MIHPEFHKHDELTVYSQIMYPNGMRSYNLPYFLCAFSMVIMSRIFTII
jgi:hypothetical protein